MADLAQCLAQLETDSDDAVAWSDLAQSASPSAVATVPVALAAAKKWHRDRGRFDVVVRLIDIELGITTNNERRADLLLEKGMVFDDDLLDAKSAVASFEAALALRPGDEVAIETLAQIALTRDNWEKFANKFVDEAKSASDRQLATSLHLSAAEVLWRYSLGDPSAPNAPAAIEAHLKQSLVIDPRNRKAAQLLDRWYALSGRHAERVALLADRMANGATREDRGSAAQALALLQERELGQPEAALATWKQTLAIEPGNRAAVRAVAIALRAAGDWAGVIAAYDGALRTRRSPDPDEAVLLLAAGETLWRDVHDAERAEDYFRRLRTLEPANPIVLDFYRAFYTARGESGKLLQVLKQAEKAGPPRARATSVGGLAGGGAISEGAPLPTAHDASGLIRIPGSAPIVSNKQLAIEIAKLAESQPGNVEKAIEAWKQVVRADPADASARGSLARLLRKAEKWNALLDLTKEEEARRPEGDIDGRVASLFEMVEIYRDRLKLDGMVINTYQAILKLDPDNVRAIDELSAKYRALARWNDLIATLSRKTELPTEPPLISIDERVAILREVAELWIERFGNFAQAIRPLERVLELVPADPAAIASLKDIYARRRQWRPLISLLEQEAATLPPAARRAKQTEMAKLAMERVGDQRLAIEIWNQSLSEAANEAGADLRDAYVGLAGLYERERRWLALVEILSRQRAIATPADAVPLLERLGGVFVDRLAAPAQAAECWREILEIDPAHAKALRTLRELYAQAGDYDSLEKLYHRLGQDDELVESLVALADRLDDRNARTALLERAANIAQRRAEATPRADLLDKTARAWERVLAADPDHLVAAKALAPYYQRAEKWPRLLPALEVQLQHATERGARLALMAELRALCETRLGSRSMAFAWAAKSFELAPADDELRTEVLRLGQDIEQMRDLVGAFDRAAANEADVPLSQRIALLRDISRLRATRLSDVAGARTSQQQILDLAPNDAEATGRFEELSAQLADWPAMIASARARAARTSSADAKVEILLEIALGEEQRLGNLDAAAATYHEVRTLAPNHLRALRALARVQEVRADWADLAVLITAELELLASDADAIDGTRRYELLMKLGGLEEARLGRIDSAVEHYRAALQIVGVDGAPRAEAFAALARLIETPADDAPPSPLGLDTRAAIAKQLLPFYELRRDSAGIARCLELLRAMIAPDNAEQTARGLEIDRRLLTLYVQGVGDPGRAWTTALRILAAAPTDEAIRRVLDRLSNRLGRDGELATALESALTSLRAREGHPTEVRALASSLAGLAATRLADDALAERAWRVVLEVEPEAADGYTALAAMFRGHARWNELRDLYEHRINITMDEVVRRDALMDLAALEEDVVGDADRAIAANIKLLSVDPGYPAAFRALDRLYTQAQRWVDVDALWELQAEHVDGLAAHDLSVRRAALKADRLGDIAAALDLIEDVLTRAPDHAAARRVLEVQLATVTTTADSRVRIATLLEPLYAADGEDSDVVEMLRIQRDAAAAREDAPALVELSVRLAALEENALATPAVAFETWRRAFLADPSEARARSSLLRLARSLQTWEAASKAWHDALARVDVADVAVRVALLGELATIVDVELGDSKAARAVYRELLAADSSNPDTNRRAGAALARLYEADSRWPELRDVLRGQVNWTDDGAERRALLARVAVLEEMTLQDSVAAVSSWQEVLVESSNDREALDALERLFGEQNRWLERIEIMRRRLDDADSRQAADILGRIAEIYENRLESINDAIASHHERLDHVADHLEALAELSRLYRGAQRPADLVEVLERRLSLSKTHASSVELESEIAKLLGDSLARPADALARWGSVLELDPSHAMAVAAVEAAVEDPELRGRATEILRPLYIASHADERLATLVARLAAASTDPHDRMERWREAAQLRSSRLGDFAGAFDAILRALDSAAAETELPELLKEVERLAGELGRESDLIDVYRQLAPNVLDADLQRRLYLDVADLARAVRGDAELAREHYQKVLDSQPDDRRAILALESLHREAGDAAALWDVLQRKTEGSGFTADERSAALIESAQLASGPLARADAAMTAWSEVFDASPQHAEAAAALEQLYRADARWHELVDLYVRRLGFAETVEAAVALQLALADVQLNQLRDSEAAVESYGAALSGDPGESTALGAVERMLADPVVRVAAANILEPIYVASQNWLQLVRIYEVKLEAATDATERLDLTRFLGRLYEEQLEDLEGASRWYARLFHEKPSDEVVRDQLYRLASIVENWAFLASTYQTYLDEESGDSETTRDVALAAAAIYDRRLDDLERAQRAYRRAVAIPATHREFGVPDDREVLRRLEDVLMRAQAWPTLIEVYDDVVSNVGTAPDNDSNELSRIDGSVRRELVAKKAVLLEQRLGDHARAIDAWRDVASMSLQAGDFAVVDAVSETLERLYRARAQWYDLTELLQARIERASLPGREDDAKQVVLRLRLAEVLENELRDVPSAIEQFELVLRAERGWEPALAPLERLVLIEEHRERIADLLEPVYRSKDWWQKLVVILDAKLAFVEDSELRVAMLREIAHIHEQRGGDVDFALAALARAWRTDVGNDAVLAQLTQLASRMRAWDELIAILVEGAAAAFDPETVASIWSQVAVLHENERGDVTSSIEAWRKVLEGRGDDMAALSALDRLLAVAGRPDELVHIVERRAEANTDVGIKLVLLHRVAALYEEVLGKSREAITAYRNVLAIDGDDVAALEGLERLFGASGESHELAETLARKIELTTDANDKRRLRFALAKVHDEARGDRYAAIEQLHAVLADDAGDLEALLALEEIHRRERSWSDLLEVLDRRIMLEQSIAERAELAFVAAELVDLELLDADAAVARYGTVLDIEPEHNFTRDALWRLASQESLVRPATTILERVYRAEGNAPGLVNVYERRLADPQAFALEHAGNGDDVLALSDVHELMRDDVAAAFAVWARALPMRPGDSEVLSNVERLAGQGGTEQWSALGSLLDSQLAARPAPDHAHMYAMKLGALQEDALADLAAAARAYESAAATGVDDSAALSSLARVLKRAGRAADLAAVLERQAELADSDHAAAEFLFRKGELLEGALRDSATAALAYRDALARVPTHSSSRGALLCLLDDAAARAVAVETLEPLYEQESDWPRLFDVLTAKRASLSDRIDRAALAQRLTELADRELADPGKAFAAALQWLTDDPSSSDALGVVEHLAAARGSWAHLAEALPSVIAAAASQGSGFDAIATTISLSLMLARVQLDQLGDRNGAAATLETARALDPESLAVVELLSRAYRESDNDELLAVSEWRRGELTGEPDAKRDAFSTAADLRERQGDLDGAVRAWETVLDIGGGAAALFADRIAFDRLAALHELRGDVSALIAVLERIARLANDAGNLDDEKDIRRRVARLEERRDPAAAARAWQALVDLDSNDDSALNSLEAAQRQLGDWSAVASTLQRRLDIATVKSDRVEILGELATIVEKQQPGNRDEAISQWYAVLDVDSGNRSAFEHLERLLTAADRHHDLVELLERRADYEGTLGDIAGELRTLARAADVWTGPLGNLDASRDVLDKILRRDPNSVFALTRLAKIYESGGDWMMCSDVLAQALALGPTGSDAAELFTQLGTVAIRGTGDLDTARAHYLEALRHDPHSVSALEALETLARESGNDAELAALLEGRLDGDGGGMSAEQKRSLLLEIIELQRRVGNLQAAVPRVEAALRAAPGDLSLVALLADLYTQNDRGDLAATLFDQLVEDARTGRRLKDVARFRQRQGSLLEARGDVAGAMAAYDEAFRVNPTDTLTMAGLGRLAMAAKDWEKARRVYRSMVLQNLDPTAGITKGQVYLALGDIHVAEGDSLKARGMYQRGLETEPQSAQLKAAIAALDAK